MGLDLALSRRHGSGLTAVETTVLYLRKGWSMFNYFENNFGMGQDGATKFIEVEDVYKLIDDLTEVLEDCKKGSFEKAEEIYPICRGDIQIEDYDDEYIAHVERVLNEVKENMKNFDERFEDLIIYGSY